MTTASMRSGLTPAAARFCGNRPTLGAKCVPPPASTRMSFLPVLISQVFSGVGNAHLGQVGVVEKFFGARFVAGEQRVVEREAAVAHHRHLVVADLDAVIAGRLRAGDWRSHVLLP